jgi:hypothetical protein
MIDVPFSFGVGFFYRIFVPGLAAGFLVTLFRGDFSTFTTLERITIFGLESFAIGLVLQFIRSLTFDFLYGIAYWPTWLRSLKIASLNGHLAEAQRQARENPAAQRYISFFPFDEDGNRNVVAPTLVGNILRIIDSYFTAKHKELPEPKTFVDRIDRELLMVRFHWNLPKEIRQEIRDDLAWFVAQRNLLVVVSLGCIAFFAKGLWELWEAFGPDAV